MVRAVVMPTAEIEKQNHPGKARFGTTTIVSISAALVLASLLVIHFWPFQQKRVLQNLHEASDSLVQVRAFHNTYLPRPGCILEGVTFLHGKDTAKPLITIERVTITGTYLGILLHRVSLINAQGMKVFIPPFGSGQALHARRSTVTIGEIVANGATVEFASRRPDTPPLRFDIREARLRNVGWSGPLSYSVKMHNPEPPGEIASTGKFGVWNENDPAQTPLSGEYKLENADLSIYGGIAGILSSTGTFAGTLGHVDVSGTADTPNFEITSGGHPVPLTAEFKAYVDATHGNTFLEHVDAHFRKTHILAQGSIAKSPGEKEKNASIDLSAKNARIEDILGLFVKKDRSPMSGAVTLRANAQIPSGDWNFLEKITLRGNFGIGGAEFSQLSTQEQVNKLSASASGEKDTSDPQTVLTDLTGKVVLDNGLAHLTDLSFGVPGAAARMHGTYNLIDHKIDLHGQMQVRSKISKTTSGARSFLLKLMDPFFKKRNKGEILPVKVSGTYENPSVGLDLMDKKAEVPPPSHNPSASTPGPSHLPKPESH